MKSAAVKHENGNACTTLEAQGERWRRHFTKILNIQSDLDEEELERVRQRPLRPELADVPSEEEIWIAVGKLKNGKDSDASGILPEMIKAACCEEEFMSQLMELVHMFGRSTVFQVTGVMLSWCPSLRKVRFSCDNWRGISLLDVAGNVVARVLQETLQILTKEELPESQCGFRKGRSCTDMIFTVRQLVQKSWEHKSKAFLTFVDLKKSYDSVPRMAL